MKAKKYFFLLSTLFFIFTNSQFFAGFITGTLVKTENNLVPIEQLKVGDLVVCQDNNNQSLLRPITSILYNKMASIARLKINNNYIFTDINQQFYLLTEKKWCSVQKIKSGQKLLAHNKDFVILEDIEIIKITDDVYDLSIEEFHNFFVSQDNILAHNFVVTIPVVAFGLGKAAFFTGVTIKTILAAVGAGIMCKCIQNKTGIPIDTEIGIDGTFNGKPIPGVYDKGEEIPKITHHKESQKKNKKHGKERGPAEIDAQAPGKPTEKDGYFPSKNWDGKKIKHPKNGKVGWPDRKGNLWVPSGPNGHGGPHWDVQYPDGSHDNIIPGGRIRGEK